MERYRGAEGVAVVANVVAVIFFAAVVVALALAGYKDMAYLVSLAAGVVGGMALVGVLATSSRRFGRPVAIGMLALFVVSAAALVLTTPEIVVGLLEPGSIAGSFLRGLTIGFFTAVFLRLLGIEVRGRPRGSGRRG